jgi:putative ABC transport system permease protein
MNRNLSKIFRREAGHSPGRFIAIFLIIVLGAGFFAGLQSAAPSMEATADAYFDSSRMADFRLLCTMGVTEDDVAAIAALPEVSEAAPAYSADVKASLGGQSAVGIYAVYSLPESTEGAWVTDGAITTGLSRPTLTEGRLPAVPGECLADIDSDMKIGDTIVLSETNAESTLEFLVEHSLTVVGVAQTPAYIDPDRGYTSSGDTIRNYLYVPPSAFESDYYTEIDLRLKDTDKLSAFSDEYEALVKKEAAALETLLQSRAQDRYDELYKEAEE